MRVIEVSPLKVDKVVHDVKIDEEAIVTTDETDDFILSQLDFNVIEQSQPEGSKNRPLETKASCKIIKPSQKLGP